MIIRGHMREGKQQLVRMLHLSDDAQPGSFRAMLLFGLGTLVSEISDYAEAKRYFDQCLDIARKLGDEPMIAQATTSLSWVDTESGDLEQGITLARDALELHRKRGDKRGMALALNSLGTAAVWRGQLEEAERWFNESIELRRQLGDRRGVGYLQVNLGMALLHRGRFDQAASILDEALATFILLRDTQLTAWNLSARGQLALITGDLASARAVLEESVRLWKDVGNKFGLAWSLSFLGLAESHAHNVETAKALLAEAERVFAETGSRPGLAIARRASAEMFVLMGDLQHGARALRDALTLTSALPDRVGIAALLELIAQLSARAREWIHAALFLATAASLREQARAPVTPLRKPAIDLLHQQVAEASGEQFPITQEQAKTAPLSDVLQVAQRFLRQLASSV
jgi:tetratricopeptide (TPR) repeat protein